MFTFFPFFFFLSIRRGQRCPEKSIVAEDPVESTRRYENKNLKVEKGPDKAVVQRLAIESSYEL